jgi:hypothetical protein
LSDNFTHRSGIDRLFKVRQVTEYHPFVSRVRSHAAQRSALLALFIVSLFVPFFDRSVAAQEGEVNREYPLKALFLYNFGSYIEWPSNCFPDEHAPFTIGVIGSSPLIESLQQIAATKKIGNRKILVTRFENANQIGVCQMLFVPASIPLPEQRSAIAAVKGRPVLLVGETPGFANDGGSMNFIVQANKIRFEVNLAATKEQQLKVSSKLLAMAKIVDAENGPIKR